MGVGFLFPFHHVVLGIEPRSSDLMAPTFIPAEAISLTLRDFLTFQEAEGEATLERQGRRHGKLLDRALGSERIFPAGDEGELRTHSDSGSHSGSLQGRPGRHGSHPEDG